MPQMPPAMFKASVTRLVAGLVSKVEQPDNLASPCLVEPFPACLENRSSCLSASCHPSTLTRITRNDSGKRDGPGQGPSR